MVKFEQQNKNKERYNKLKKLCFSTSISALLEEFLLYESIDESTTENKGGKLVEPLIISDARFVKELEKYQ